MNTVLRAVNYRDNHVINSSDYSDNCVAFKSHSAEFIVYRPFPCGVNMSVEKNSSFYFAGASLCGSNVVTFLFFKKSVNEFFVKSELHKRDKKTDDNKYNGENRREEEEDYRSENKSHCKIQPAVERSGVFVKRFYRRLFASAVFFHNILKILACFFFAFGTR